MRSTACLSCRIRQLILICAAMLFVAFNFNLTFSQYSHKHWQSVLLRAGRICAGLHLAKWALLMLRPVASVNSLCSSSIGLDSSIVTFPVLLDTSFFCGKMVDEISRKFTISLKLFLLSYFWFESRRRKSCNVVIECLVFPSAADAALAVLCPLQAARIIFLDAMDDLVFLLFMDDSKLFILWPQAASSMYCAVPFAGFPFSCCSMASWNRAFFLGEALSCKSKTASTYLLGLFGMPLLGLWRFFLLATGVTVMLKARSSGSEVCLGSCSTSCCGWIGDSGGVGWILPCSGCCIELDGWAVSAFLYLSRFAKIIFMQVGQFFSCF